MLLPRVQELLNVLFKVEAGEDQPFAVGWLIDCVVRLLSLVHHVGIGIRHSCVVSGLSLASSRDERQRRQEPCESEHTAMPRPRHGASDSHCLSSLPRTLRRETGR
jgi:hypothetical protein